MIITSSIKNIAYVWLKQNFISKFFAQHILCIFRTQISNERIGTTTEFNFSSLPNSKIKISLAHDVLKFSLKLSLNAADQSVQMSLWTT